MGFCSLAKWRWRQPSILLQYASFVASSFAGVLYRKLVGVLFLAYIDLHWLLVVLLRTWWNGQTVIAQVFQDFLSIQEGPKFGPEPTLGSHLEVDLGDRLLIVNSRVVLIFLFEKDLLHGSESIAPLAEVLVAEARFETPQTIVSFVENDLAGVRGLPEILVLSRFLDNPDGFLVAPLDHEEFVVLDPGVVVLLQTHFAMRQGVLHSHHRRKADRLSRWSPGKRFLSGCYSFRRRNGLVRDRWQGTFHGG